MIACRIQAPRRKTWEIWSRAVTSGRQKVDTQGAVTGSIKGGMSLWCGQWLFLKCHFGALMWVHNTSWVWILCSRCFSKKIKFSLNINFITCHHWWNLTTKFFLWSNNWTFITRQIFILDRVCVRYQLLASSWAYLSNRFVGNNYRWHYCCTSQFCHETFWIHVDHCCLSRHLLWSKKTRQKLIRKGAILEARWQEIGANVHFCIHRSVVQLQHLVPREREKSCMLCPAKFYAQYV